MPFARTCVVPHPADPQENLAFALSLWSAFPSALDLGASSGEDHTLSPVSARKTFVTNAFLYFAVCFRVLACSQQSTLPLAKRALLPSLQNNRKQDAFIPLVPTCRNNSVHRSRVHSFLFHQGLQVCLNLYLANCLKRVMINTLCLCICKVFLPYRCCCLSDSVTTILTSVSATLSFKCLCSIPCATIFVSSLVPRCWKLLTYFFSGPETFLKTRWCSVSQGTVLPLCLCCLNTVLFLSENTT